MKILIADDVPSNRKVLEVMLSRHGRCDAVCNGQEAFEAWRRALDSGEGFALVCLDIMMPDPGGRDTFEQIRAEESRRGIAPAQRVKVLFITMLDDLRDLEDLMRDPGALRLTKPVKPEQLTQALKQLGLAPAVTA